MDDTTLWDSDAVPSSPPTSIDEESVATKHDVSLAEDTETEIEPKKRRLQVYRD